MIVAGARGLFGVLEEAEVLVVVIEIAGFLRSRGGDGGEEQGRSGEEKEEEQGEGSPADRRHSEQSGVPSLTGRGHSEIADLARFS